MMPDSTAIEIIRLVADIILIISASIGVLSFLSPVVRRFLREHVVPKLQEFGINRSMVLFMIVSTVVIGWLVAQIVTTKERLAEVEGEVEEVETQIVTSMERLTEVEEEVAERDAQIADIVQQVLQVLRETRDGLENLRRGP